jgi:hypothetical protein
MLHSVDSCPIMDNTVSIIIGTESYLYQQKKFSPIAPGEHIAGAPWYMFSRGKVARAMRLITYLHLVPKLRMRGAISTLPLYAVHRDSFTFHCCLLCIYRSVLVYLYPSLCDWLLNFIPFISKKSKVGPVNPMKSHGVTPHSQPSHFWRRKKIF